MIKQCPFCAEEIRNAIFVESTFCYGIYNIAPIVRGHVLILPKQHEETVLHLSSAIYSDFMNTILMVTRGLMKAYSSSGVNWTLQDGLSAGQTVSHVHMHIIPRNEGDFETPGDWYHAFIRNEFQGSDKRKRLSNSQMMDEVAYLRSFF